MKHLKFAFASLALFITVHAFAEQPTFQVPAAKVEKVINGPTVDATQKNGLTTMVSARTGIRYTIENPTNRPVVFKTEAIAPANSTNVSRIAASNPALSAESQQQAQQALLDLQK